MEKGIDVNGSIGGTTGLRWSVRATSASARLRLPEAAYLHVVSISARHRGGRSKGGEPTITKTVAARGKSCD